MFLKKGQRLVPKPDPWKYGCPYDGRSPASQAMPVWPLQTTGSLELTASAPLPQMNPVLRILFFSSCPRETKASGKNGYSCLQLDGEGFCLPSHRWLHSSPSFLAWLLGVGWQCLTMQFCPSLGTCPIE